MSDRRVTLREIAMRSGVSQATVSKVLNDRSEVAPSTRERVRKALDELGYERVGTPPMATTAPPVIAVFESVASQYASMVLQGIISAAKSTGHDVVVRLVPPVPADARPHSIRDWIGEARPLAGIIAVTSLTPADVSAEIQRRGIPFVAVDPIDSFDESVVSLGSTDWAGARAATEHLLALGHTRVGWVGGPRGSAPTIERFQGYRAALELAGVEDDPEVQLSGLYEFESGLELGGRILDSGHPVTAIVCASDSIAFGVMEAARQRHIPLPAGLSVVGFDDIPQTEWSSPKLTSVRAPLVGIGRMAMETLLALTEGREPVSHHIQLSTTLIVRESTSAPADRDAGPLRQDRDATVSL